MASNTLDGVNVDLNSVDDQILNGGTLGNVVDVLAADALPADASVDLSATLSDLFTSDWANTGFDATGPGDEWVSYISPDITTESVDAAASDGVGVDASFADDGSVNGDASVAVDDVYGNAAQDEAAALAAEDAQLIQDASSADGQGADPANADTASLDSSNGDASVTADDVYGNWDESVDGPVDPSADTGGPAAIEAVLPAQPLPSSTDFVI